MKLFRELLSVHTGASFQHHPASLAHMRASDTVHKLPPTHRCTHANIQGTTLHTEHLLGSGAHASVTEATEMFGCHLKVQEVQRKNDKLLLSTNFLFLNVNYCSES